MLVVVWLWVVCPVNAQIQMVEAPQAQAEEVHSLPSELPTYDATEGAPAEVLRVKPLDEWLVLPDLRYSLVQSRIPQISN